MNYNKLDIDNFIDMILKNKKMCPVLMIGKYVNRFKQKFDGTIERIYTLEDVRNVVREYEGIEHINSEYLVLDGIGYLSQVGQNSLLKFIEESKLPIILLSYTDKVSPIIMSRMKIVVKRWYHVKSLNFMSIENAIKGLKEKEDNSDNKLTEIERIQYMADNCPLLYGIWQQSGDKFDYTNERLIQLMTHKKG